MTRDQLHELFRHMYGANNVIDSVQPGPKYEAVFKRVAAAYEDLLVAMKAEWRTPPDEDISSKEGDYIIDTLEDMDGPFIKDVSSRKRHFYEGYRYGLKEAGETE